MWRKVKRQHVPDVWELSHVSGQPQPTKKKKKSEVLQNLSIWQRFYINRKHHKNEKEKKRQRKDKEE